MGLTIQTTPARIGIEHTPGKLEIQTQRARLEVRQKQAKLNIHTEQVRLLIDQQEAFASAGLKSAGEITREAAERGLRQALEFTGKTAEDGYRLAAIEKGGNPIAEIAKQDSLTVHEFGYDYIPKVGPKFDVMEGTVELQAEPNDVEGNYTPGYADVSYTPARIRIYMQQYASVRMSYSGSKMDAYI